MHTNTYTLAFLLSIIFLSGCASSPNIRSQPTHPPVIDKINHSDFAMDAIGVWGEDVTGPSELPDPALARFLTNKLTQHYAALDINLIKPTNFQMSATTAEHIFDPQRTPWNSPSQYQRLQNSGYDRYIAYYKVNDNVIEKEIDEDADEKCYYTTRTIDMDFFIADIVAKDIVWLDNIVVDDTNSNCYEHPDEDRFKTGKGVSGFFAQLALEITVGSVIDSIVESYPSATSSTRLLERALEYSVRRLP